MRAVLAAALLLGACQRDAAPDAPVPADSTAPAAATSSHTTAWPQHGPVDVRRTTPVDFDGDGQDEQVVVSARGPRYDSLDVALTIVNAQQDTLWHEHWPSLFYFQYDPIEGKADSTVARIVRAHVDELLADENLQVSGGLPPALSHADPRQTMREAAQYHLAELDWRRAADLSPADPTPPDAHSTIRASTVPMERVDAAIAEIVQRPVFMYYAGGEATYAIGWSARENAFVRVYACC